MADVEAREQTHVVYWKSRLSTDTLSLLPSSLTKANYMVKPDINAVGKFFT
jgi:hypothetical protein